MPMDARLQEAESPGARKVESSLAFASAPVRAGGEGMPQAALKGLGRFPRTTKEPWEQALGELPVREVVMVDYWRRQGSVLRSPGPTAAQKNLSPVYRR